MSASMEQIAAQVAEINKRLQDSEDKRLDAFTTLLSSIESTLADMLENIERGGGAAAIERMAEAFQTLKLQMPEISPSIQVQPANVTVNVPKADPPSVEVKVQPTPVNVQVPEAKPPVIHVGTPVGAVFQIVFNRNEQTALTEGATLTRVK